MKNNDYNSLRNQNIWIDDNSVSSCHNCKDDFSLFNRRHHCRLCGKIFCYQCCNYNVRTNLKDELINIEDYLDECLNNNLKLKHKKKLCFQCNKILLNISQISQYIKIIQLLPLNLSNIYKLVLVNKNWNKAILYYLYNFKKLHYITIYDNILHLKDTLNINKEFIGGHNKLISLYIILNSNNWKKEDVRKNLELLEKRKIKCKSLLCKKNCTEKLSNYNILYILFYVKNKYVKEELLKKLKITDIKIYMPLFLKLIENDSISDYSITDYIISHCDKIELCIELFLQLFIIVKNRDSLIYKNVLQRIKNKINNSDNNKYNIITNSIKFINKLTTLNIQNIDNNVIELNNFIKENDIYIPFSSKKVKFISSNIIVKESKTNPIILEVYFIDNTKMDVLYKKEDVRTDYIICNIISFIKTIIKDNKLVSYNILPINTMCGLIEIVPDSYTLYNIKEEENMSLQNFIMENNKKETIECIKNRFLDSLSIYSVITYVLGIGDRHLDNIMITNTGLLFHIDYSFCMGYDPKPFYPCIRLTKEMIDMIGGMNSGGYKEFLKRSNNYYNIIRKYTSVLSLYIILLHNIDKDIFNLKFLDEHIKKKLIYPETDNYAENALSDTIINNSEDYSYIDFIHYHSKEKTVSKTIYNIYDNSLSISIYLKNKLFSFL